MTKKKDHPPIPPPEPEPPSEEFQTFDAALRQVLSVPRGHIAELIAEDKKRKTAIDPKEPTPPII